MATQHGVIGEMKSKTVPIGAVSTELLEAVENGKTVVSMLHIGNVDGTNSATVDIVLNKAGAGDVTLVKDLTVAANEIQVIYSHAAGRLILDGIGTPDVLKATASAAGDLVATISYVERA